MKWPRLLPLIGLALVFGCQDAVQIAEVSAEREANQILDVLYSAGLPDAAKQRTRRGRDVGWVVATPAGQAAAAIQILNDHGLPAPPKVRMRDLLTQNSLIASPADEQLRFEQGKASELEQLLENLDGVLAAQVELAVAPPTPRGPATPTRCAVTLRYLAGAAPPDLAAWATEIKALAAHSVPHLTPEHVTVVFSRTQPRPIDVPARVAGAARPFAWLPGSAGAPLGLLIVGAPWLLLLIQLLRRLAQRWKAPPAVPTTA